MSDDLAIDSWESDDVSMRELAEWRMASLVVHDLAYPFVLFGFKTNISLTRDIHILCLCNDLSWS